MAIRRVGSLGAAAALGCAAILISHPLTSQEPGAAPPLVVTAFGDKPAPPYTVPRTSWGDPDLQGAWSSDDTSGVPMSRREEHGDRLYLTEEELAQRAEQVARGVERAENEATSSFRGDFARRALPQTSLIVDPADGRLPAFTEEGTKRPMPRGTYGNGPLDSYTDFSGYERCITRGIAGSTLRVVYGNGQRIVQAPGVVALTYEMIHDTRLLYTDGRPHLNQSIRQYLGDSRAHWEGDELVVETTNLTDRTAIGPNGNGNRHSPQMKMTERFKRVADDVLQYQLTVDDPVTYTRPFTLSLPLTPLDGGKLLPYDCHEGNYAILQSLGGERAEDRALEADRKRGIIRERRPVQGGLGVGGAPVSEGGGLPPR
jgi:hypothetical protein